VRYSPDHKAENHEKILSLASRSFREHGGDSSGIGKVMKNAGLTKGGFYRHFESKDDLFVQGVARAFEEMGTSMAAIARAAPEGQELRAVIEHYLSERHVQSPGVGCVFSALGPELARKPVAVRRKIEASLQGYRERLLPFMPGRTAEEKTAKFQLLFPSMAGVLTATRVTSSPHKRAALLAEARKFFINSFC
jgi:TetR/AcrR family transcriptional repressor of nem operon